MADNEDDWFFYVNRAKTEVCHGGFRVGFREPER